MLKVIVIPTSPISLKVEKLAIIPNAMIFKEKSEYRPVYPCKKRLNPLGIRSSLLGITPTFRCGEHLNFPPLPVDQTAVIFKIPFIIEINHMALNESWLKAHHGKPQDGQTVRADRDGLSAKLSPHGKITWLFRYRWTGKAKSLTLGSYPATPLAAARAEAVRLRGELEQNRDPALIRSDERAAAMGATTVEEIIREWLNKYCVPRKKAADEIIRSFEIHVFPAMGHQLHDQTLPLEWFDLLEKLNEYKPGIARRILINAKQAHSWSARRQMTTHQPLGEIKMSDVGIINKYGKRVLSDEEIKILFHALDISRINIKYKLFIKLCFLFGCRTGELSFALKDHFNFHEGIWTVPPELHKTGEQTGRPIIRPIIPAAREMLEELFAIQPSKYVICKRAGHQPLGRATLTDLPRSIENTARKRLSASLCDWSLHDLRRTARTNFSSFCEPHVAETMIGHTLPGLFKVYDHNHYLDEQRRAYGLWWAKIESLAYGEGKVATLRLANS